MTQPVEKLFKLSFRRKLFGIFLLYELPEVVKITAG
jgi:hypothetical protein